MSGDGAGNAVQHVTAEGGFAYGVQGADIHVFGDGTPVYVLQNWRPAPRPDPEWLREPPSRMLNARFAVVEFTGREEELGQLLRWRDEGPRLAARWLHGPAGAGKTRLAAELAERSADAGWKVVTATHGPGSVLPPPGSQDLRTDGAAGLLLIVDYADQWPYTHLAWLLSNAVLHRPGLPARVLMLARGRDAWPAIRAALANQQAATSGQALGPLPVDGPARPRMITAARDGFARRYGIGDPVPLPAVPDDPAMGTPLALHMAALVAVDTHANGGRQPADLAGLTVYLLDREHQHWAKLYREAAPLIGPRPEFRTPPEVMNRTVFTAVLTGAVAREAGAGLLERAGVPGDRERVLADHLLCYPGEGDGRVLEPLYPDRLAEDFLALTVPGHAADYPHQDWAAGSATALMAGDRVPRPVTFLANAAGRWPHVGSDYLYPLLRRSPDLAVDGGSAVLSALAGAPDTELDMLEGVDRLLTKDAAPDLAAGAAALCARLTPHRLAASDDPAERAGLLITLSDRLSRAGRHEEALPPARLGADHYRRLARTGPAHLPALADALINLGNCLGRIGRYHDARELTQEALDLRRRLAEHDPSRRRDVLVPLTNLGAYLMLLDRPADALGPTREAIEMLRENTGDQSGLGAALTNLGAVLYELDRLAEALPPVREAVEACRREFESDPARTEFALAESLSNLGVLLTDLGRASEAVPVLQEAVALIRPLSRANPAVYRGKLASLLTRLGSALNGAGQHEDALTVTLEAIAIHRGSADEGPLGIADALVNLGNYQSALGRPQDALAPTREAIGLLAGITDTRFRPWHILAITNLAGHHRKLGQRPEALAAAREAAALNRALARDGRPHRMTGAARKLERLSQLLADLGAWDETFATAGDAVTLLRRSAEHDPERHLPDLALALGNQAAWYLLKDRWAEALAPAREAVDLRRELAGDDPSALAGAQDNLARVLGGLGRYTEAVTVGLEVAEGYRRRDETFVLAELLRAVCYWQDLAGHRTQALATAREAVEAYRRLPGDPPEPVLVGQAVTLQRLSSWLGSGGRFAEAVGPGRETVAAYRRLVAIDRAAHLAELGMSLFSLALAEHSLGRTGEAVTLAREAADAYRESATPQPGVFGSVLTNLGHWLWALNRQEEAIAAMREAAEVYRLLAETDPGRYLGEVGRLHTDLVIRLSPRPAEALPSARAAADAYRRLVRVDPAAPVANLAASAHNLGLVLYQLNRHAEALPALEEAIAVRTRLAGTDPDGQLPHLAGSLEDLANCLAAMNRYPEAVRPTRFAAEIRRGLAGADPARHLPDLAAVLVALGLRLDRVGQRAEAERTLAEGVQIFEVLARLAPQAYADRHRAATRAMRQVRGR